MQKNTFFLTSAREVQKVQKPEVKKVKFKVNTSRLLELLAVQGYNKTSFGRASGLSYQTLMNVFNNTQMASPRVAKKICDTLQIELTEVFTLTNE